MSIYLGSVIIVEVGAAMVISPLLKFREISDPASLVVLAHSVGARASCEDDSAAQVYRAGITAMKI